MDMLLNNDNLSAKKILILLLKWSQKAMDNTKNTIKENAFGPGIRSSALFLPLSAHIGACAYKRIG